LKVLTKSLKDDGHEFVYVRPGLIAAYYLADPLKKLGPRIAGTIERYRAFVGPGSLTAYLAENGTYKALAQARLDRDGKLLRKLPAKADLRWIYSSNNDGGVGEYKIHLFASDPDDDFPEMTTLLRLEFPADAAKRYGLEELVRFIIQEAEQLEAQSGNAGWAFKRAEAFASEARKAVNAFLPRYLGFDPCFDLAGLEMRGQSPWAHWINLLDRDLFGECGGEKAIRATAPDAKLEKYRGGVAIRASKFPPIGDVNRGAKDLGSMADVERFLTPIRIKLDGLGDNVFDIKAWLSRFDDRQPGEWDN
jgi:hypothetical protein